jgi:hypothetical protein
MGIREYPSNHNSIDVICRDTSIVGKDNVYMTNGQGCRTIYYDSVKAARKSLSAHNKVITGQNLCNCIYCACHYSNKDPMQALFPWHLCHKAKLEFAKMYR